MLQDKGLSYVNLGGYEGRNLGMKLKEFADSLKRLGGIVEDFKPDLILTERYPPAVHVAHLAEIPCWTIFNDEREFHVNRLTHPLAAKVLVPSFYPKEMLRKNGVTVEENIVWFNGFITCYLKGARLAQSNPFTALDGFVEGSPVVLVRPEFEFSVFFGQYKPVLQDVVKTLLARFDLNVVVLPRTSKQRRRYRRIGAIVPESALPGMPIAHADVVVGSAETMLCEAFTLGIPSVSCIYWDLTVPMKVLHRYIQTATDPGKVFEIVAGFIESPEAREAYRKVSQSVIGDMQNPVEILCSQLDVEPSKLKP